MRSAPKKNMPVVLKETKADDCRYKYEYYKRIDTLVEESELIKAAESELHPYFKNILIKILRQVIPCFG